MAYSNTGPDVNPAERVQILIDLTASLSLIFEEENAAIEAQRASDAAPLQAEKARLASAYAQSIRAVASDRARMSTVDSELLLRLQAATASFEARAARQRSLLDNAGADRTTDREDAPRRRESDRRA